MRDVWAQIDLNAIRKNYKIINEKITGGAKLCAVVKANAYGHGAIPIAIEALKAGASYLAVATADEGIELRNAGITAPILILGISPKSAAAEIVHYDLTQGTADSSLAKAVSAAAMAQNKTAKLHLKVETGMGRIGASVSEAPNIAKEIVSMPNVKLEGIYSHFAAADEKDKSFVCSFYINPQ